MHEQPLPDKASVIRLLLETEGRVMVCLDATQKGVDVPRRFIHDTGLILVFNTNMPQPIDILEDCVASELRFGGIPHYCVIPYTAIWSAFNPDTNHGMIWPDSMPEGTEHNLGLMQLSLEQPLEEDAQEGFRTEEGQTSLAASVPARKGSPFLQVIDGGGARSEPAAAQRLDSGSDRGRRSHLRLVE